MERWSIMGIVDHFTTIFAPKLVTFFSPLRQNVVYIQNRPLYGKAYPSSTICISRISGDISIGVTRGTKSTIIKYAYMCSWGSKG